MITFGAPSGQPSPFQRTSGLLNGNCYSRTGGTTGAVEGMAAWSFPVLVAGIDPRAESELTGLGRASPSPAPGAGADRTPGLCSLLT